jgi:Protein of unknown function (DUF3551)
MAQSATRTITPSPTTLTAKTVVSPGPSFVQSGGSGRFRHPRLVLWDIREGRRDTFVDRALSGQARKTLRGRHGRPRARIKALEREVRELRQANEILGKRQLISRLRNSTALSRSDWLMEAHLNEFGVEPMCRVLPKEVIMHAIGPVSISIVMMTLLVTDADAASNRWCATSPKRSENCGYATLDQCRAQVLGLGGWCRPNPFPGTAFGTSGTWSSGPPRQALL